MAIFRATQAFTFDTRRGTPRTFTPGDLIDSNDPDFRGKEHLFEPVEEAAARASGTETASAAPGEVRSRRSYGRKPQKVDAPAEVVQPEPDPVVPVVAEPESEL